MRTFVLVFFIVLLMFGLFSCKKDNPIPPEQQPQLSLTLEDVSCTEAWIKLTTANISLPANVELLKDNIHSETISLTSTDTILYIDTLLPNKSYSFTSIIQSSDRSITSPSLPVTTMDTTSHNFTWQTWTFGGDAGGCELYDVAIIDQNDIWAVGRINIADTSINGFTTYNAVHWDGVEWELKRLRYYGNCSAVEFPPLYAIWAFSASDIIITNGGSIGWYDGNTVKLDCEVHPLLSGAINKIWGTSDNDIYVVGNNGNIAYFNGQWTKIESGTDAKIADIWGTSISTSNQSSIYCSVPSGLEPSKRRILTINQKDEVDSITCNGNIVTSVWSTPGDIFYTSGWGIYSNKSGELRKELSIPDYYSNSIRGIALNDVCVCGNYGFLAHFNGVSWKMYPEFTQLNLTLLASLSIKDGIVAVVGFSGEAALIILGERN